MSSCDILRACRKSLKMANSPISHAKISMTYKYQIPGFRLFRQSLIISPKRQTYDINSDISNITAFLEFQKPLISWRYRTILRPRKAWDILDL